MNTQPILFTIEPQKLEPRAKFVVLIIFTQK